MSSATNQAEDQKPAATSKDSTNILDDGSTGRMLHHQLLRSLYADAFLARCDKVDSDNFDLPFGTYICPWMPEEPEEEVYYECGNRGFGKVEKNVVECRVCGETVDEHRLSVHVDRCLTPLLTRAEDENDVSEQRRLLDLWRDYRDGSWEEIPEDSGEVAVANKDLEYWASRCWTRPFSLFDAAVMRRPDIDCTTAIKERHGNKKMDFGSHCFRASLLPSVTNTFPGWSPCAVQATWAPIDDSLNPTYSSYLEDPRYRMGIIYTKDSVWAYNQRHKWQNDGEVWRPFDPHFSVPSGGLNPSILGTADYSLSKQHGGPNADVWTTENDRIGQQVKPLLEDLARSTNDYPLPRYQMIIDPNQFVRSRKSDGKKVWVPCEFDVAFDGSSASLVGEDRAHWMNTKLINSVATPVLNAALPLLAKLTKPYLLLEGQRLQVVVKAQSITVPKKQSDDDAPEYIGLWHIDGEHEPVVAVVLYYYDVDDALIGGNMELMDRRPMAVFGEVSD